MDNDTEYKEHKIDSVRACDEDGWTVDFDDGWSLFVTNACEKQAPVSGETIRTYGKGIGYTVRGIVIGGRVYRYTSPDDAEIERLEMVKRLEAEREASTSEFLAKLPTLPSLPVFELSNPGLWDNIVSTNSIDPYSYECVRYAAAWASAMEAVMTGPDSVADVADEASKVANTSGITGFMYGAAVSILAQCWKHGEALRKWHNSNYGREDATGVVNPAVMTFVG